MRRIGVVALLGLGIIALSGSASAKIMAKIAPRTAAPGDTVRVVAGWGNPVGPYRTVRIYLTAPGPALHREILVLDAAPTGRNELRATFTIPKVAAAGRYGVDLCGDRGQCYRFGRLRVSASPIENGTTEPMSSREPPVRSTDAGPPWPTSATVVAGIFPLMVLVVVLKLRRSN